MGCRTTNETQKREEVYLAHELRDHPVENRSLVTKAMFPCAQCSEILYKKETASDFLSDNVISSFMK